MHHAAWDVVKAQPEGRKLEFATINPSLVQGPMLSSASCASLDLVKQIILGEMPGLVDVFMNTVDVRDVAEAHVRAMINAEAPGKRFILGSTEVSRACAGTAPPAAAACRHSRPASSMPRPCALRLAKALPLSPPLCGSPRSRCSCRLARFPGRLRRSLRRSATPT